MENLMRHTVYSQERGNTWAVRETEMYIYKSIYLKILHFGVGSVKKTYLIFIHISPTSIRITAS